MNRLFSIIPLLCCAFFLLTATPASSQTTCPEYCTTEFEYTLNGTALHAKFDFGDIDPPFFFYALWSLDGDAVTGTGLDFVHLFKEPGIHTLCATYPTGDFTPETCTVCKAIEVKVDCVNPDLIDPNIPCPAIYDPVCGCDGKTYANACEAYYHGGISSWVPGECGSICNNLFPDFKHYADGSSPEIQFEDESVFQGGSVYSWFWNFGNGKNSFEQNPKVIYNAPGSYQVCLTVSGKFADGTQCDATICRDIEVGSKLCVDSSLIDFLILCAAVYDPVCGCDGVTYPNDCIAKYHYGVSSWTPGPCQSACFSASWVDFNTACIEIYDPVCGCDGNDYDNWCHAVYYGGVRSWAKGKCCNDKPCQANFEVEYLTGNAVVLKNTSVNAHATAVNFGDGSPIFQGQVFDTLWHHYFFPGTYQICLEISDFTGECTDFVCKAVQFTTSTSEPGNGPVELTLWPNPANERVQVQVADAQPNKALMFDVYGKKVWEKRVSSEQFEVETAGLPNGVYLLQVMTDKGRGIRHLVVSH